MKLFFSKILYAEEKPLIVKPFGNQNPKKDRPKVLGHQHEMRVVRGNFPNEGKHNSDLVTHVQNGGVHA